MSLRAQVAKQSPIDKGMALGQRPRNDICISILTSCPQIGHVVKCRAFKKQLILKFSRNYSKKGSYLMAKCAHCGKSTTFGHSRSFSQRATNRTFKPNLQKTIVMEAGRPVHKVLCTKCIKALGKAAA